MEDRFDRLEGKIDALVTTVNDKFTVVDRTFEGLETRLGTGIDGVEQRLRGVDQQLSDLSLRVSVLHEDVKSDFRFSLEAQQGLKEQMEAGFAAQERALREALAPVQAAIRSAHGVPSQTT